MATKIKNSLRTFGRAFFNAMIASGEQRAAYVLRNRSSWYV
jgi:hypothetical protein